MNVYRKILKGGRVYMTLYDRKKEEPKWDQSEGTVRCFQGRQISLEPQSHP